MNTCYLGLSTHRRIHPDAIETVRAAARQVLLEVNEKAMAENSSLVMLNSLAEGGDTLLARLAIELKIPFIAVLPRPLSSYAEDFEGAAKAELFSLCAKSETLFVTPDIEKKGRDDYDYFYRQAGIFVAAKSNMQAWRNWQTRTVQVRMKVPSWRFESSCLHHELRNVCFGVFSFYERRLGNETMEHTCIGHLLELWNVCGLRCSGDPYPTGEYNRTGNRTPGRRCDLWTTGRHIQ